MTQIPFHVYWPGGNTTALVSDSFPRSQYGAIARAIIHSDPTIEQVGFLEPPADSSRADLRLQMMGGEFCGNATRSAAYVAFKKTGKQYVTVESSGVDYLVPGHVTEGSSSIILPSSFVQGVKKTQEATVVDLQGIRHVVFPVGFDAKQSKEQLLQAHKDDYPAVGIIFVSESQGLLSIDPFVWVRETDTFVHETACGSGSIAVAAALSKQTEDNTNRIVQPSGEIFTIGMTSTSIELGGPIQDKGKKSLSLNV
jgi:diaminopimelate epimerase